MWVCEELGNETIVQLKASEQFITARLQPGAEWTFDQPVWYRFRQDRVIALPPESQVQPLDLPR